jgi:coenzyme F420-reducing hydrogenase beta subunit
MDEIKIKGYIAYSKNLENRLLSTSGGLFYELAMYVLNSDGIVYGAVFDDNYQVVHVRADDLTMVGKMRGSKYVQSQLGKSFVSVKQDLRGGHLVLFTGTPCQIAGLKGYLGKNHDNLLCIDFICLGVPSPMIWSKYLDVFHKRTNIRKIIFKDKRIGWSKWTFLIESNDDIFREPGSINYYMQAYLRHLCIRPSCYNCAFRKIEHESDITIADCWGIENIKPKLNDEKGISAVLVQTTMGKKYLKKILDKIVIEETEVATLLKGNPYATKPIAINEKRSSFFQSYYRHGIKFTLKKFTAKRNILKQLKERQEWRKFSKQEYTERNQKL